MLKYTHGYVAVKTAKSLGLKGFNKLALVLGNVIPDYLPSCFYSMHTYNNWYKYFNHKRFELLLMQPGIRYYYNLGVEMHLCADFFTRPHNNDNITDFCKGHGEWEKELNHEVIKRFVLLYGYHKSIVKLHESYLHAKPGITSDAVNISFAISSLVNNSKVN